MAVNPLPEGYPRVSPYLIVDGAIAAIDYYTHVLGVTEKMRLPADVPDRLGHAELVLGDSMIMLADEHPDLGILGPMTIGGTPVMLQVYVDDVDAVFARAIEAGGRVLQEPRDEFYGDRAAQFEDPFGHRWNIASTVEDVSLEEMQRRAADQGSDVS